MKPIFPPVLILAVASAMFVLGMAVAWSERAAVIQPPAVCEDGR